jgi:hypothetical protein
MNEGDVAVHPAPLSARPPMSEQSGNRSPEWMVSKECQPYLFSQERIFLNHIITVWATFIAVLKSKLSYGEPPRTRRMTTAGFHRQMVRQKKNSFIGLYRLSAANDSKQDGNDCNHQKYVDETAQGVGSEDP